MIIGPDAALISELVGAGGDDVLVLKKGSARGANGNDWVYVLNAGASVSGGNGDDHIFGSPGDDYNTLSGNGGVDYVYGLGGNDRIVGAGGDFIFGGDGDDTVASNSNGGNTLSGGSGSNQFNINESSDPNNKRTTIQDFQLETGNIIEFRKNELTICYFVVTYDEAQTAGCNADVLYAEYFDDVMTLFNDVPNEDAVQCWTLQTTPECLAAI